VQVRAAAPTGVPGSIDVRGQTGAEAREAVRRYVDAAQLAGLPEVEIIHGRGTGAVRKAVRDELARHPLVTATETASADGATRVRFGGSQ
jgi:DNA mismatch repair protein MutS2